MPGIDLSTVSGPDLRRLLKMAHIRHEGLLADQLEWEIAARRATRGARPMPGFRKSAEDDAEAPDVPMAAPEAPSFAPAYEAETPAARSRSVLLVTLGALGGGLVSATVFWGLGRMDRPPSPARPSAETAAPQPSMGSAAPQSTVAGLASEPVPAQPESALAQSAPAPTVEVAKQTAPKKPAARRGKMELAATAQRPARPPTLTEWLADPAPAQRVDPDEPIH